MTENLVVRATERYAYGFVSCGGIYASAPSGLPAQFFGPILGRFDAELRGYDMALWDKFHKRDEPHHINGGRL